VNETQWSDCEVIARKVDEHGREHVLRCDWEKHEVTGDAETDHHDPDFGVIWHFDGDLRFDDDD
jgi:hypothetical protein